LLQPLGCNVIKGHHGVVVFLITTTPPLWLLIDYSFVYELFHSDELRD